MQPISDLNAESSPILRLGLSKGGHGWMDTVQRGGQSDNNGQIMAGRRCGQKKKTCIHPDAVAPPDSPN